MEPSLLWLRRDLRLADHRALAAALGYGGAVVPVFVWDPDAEAPWQPGAASRWWLHHSLADFAEVLAGVGSRLVLRRGDTAAELIAAAREAGAARILFHRRYEPAARRQQADVAAAAADAGLATAGYDGDALHPPGTIHTQAGDPYRVFTPFWRACRASGPPPEPAPAPARLPAPERWPGGVGLDELDLLPRVDWAGGLRRDWRPGSRGGRARVEAFLDGGMRGYDEGRDDPGRDSTSGLSPHLHFGEVGPRELWHAVAPRAEFADHAGVRRGAEQFLRQLAWRDFGRQLLWRWPHTAEANLRPEFDAMPWTGNGEGFRAWVRGRTGYPMVDAGMRQLWATGWMHNRLRMVVASFLVKHLLIDWRAGARWFWDTLVDADLANNTLGWQWAAGTGADAAPYFRIFNPIRQGERFDAGGAYVRRWVPELAGVPDRHLHAPWRATQGVLKAARVALGRDYPEPVVDHRAARERALGAYEIVKAANRAPK